MMRANSKHVLVAILVGVVFGLGLLAEYKLDVLGQIQAWRNSPTELPKLALDLAIGFRDTDKDNDLPIIQPPQPGQYSAWREALRELVENKTRIDVSRDLHSSKPEVLSEKRIGGVLQQFVVFSSFDGTQIPAYIHSPINHNDAPLPGIVLIPGHVPIGESGIEQLANLPESYQRAAAARLAEAGFVTLTFELRGFGYLGSPLNTEHVLVAYNALLQGRSYKALITQDTQVAVALLRTIDGVDKKRIGIAGSSYGGEIAVTYAALDKSIKAIAAHSRGGSSGLKRPRRGSRIDQPHYCHILPEVDSIVRSEYWYWMLAPRPVLSIRGDGDAPRFTEVLELYRQGWDGDEGLDLRVQSGGHEFFVDPTIDFFRQYL